MIRRVCFTIAAAGALLAAPALAADCLTAIGNRVSPCGFESPAEVAAWTLMAGSSFTFAAGLGENGLLTAWSSAGCGQGVIVNETDLNEEVDYCNLQFPVALTLPPSTNSGAVFGQIFQLGLTEPPGAPAGVVAKVGFAPAGASPLHPANICLWQFQPATYNVQVGNNDEFGGSFTTPPTSGSYAFAFLFSLDGANWTACDLDGAGATPGFTFDLAQAGSLTVTP